MKNFKSYGFWTALAGALVVLINAIGKCCGFVVEEQIVSDIVMAIAGVLVVFGIVSMPKKDDEGTTDNSLLDKDEIFLEANEKCEKTEEVKEEINNDDSK